MLAFIEEYKVDSLWHGPSSPLCSDVDILFGLKLIIDLTVKDRKKKEK